MPYNLIHTSEDNTATVSERKFIAPDFYKSKKAQKVQIGQRIKAHSTCKKSMLS